MGEQRCTGPGSGIIGAKQCSHNYDIVPTNLYVCYSELGHVNITSLYPTAPVLHEIKRVIRW